MTVSDVLKAQRGYYPKGAIVEDKETGEKHDFTSESYMLSAEAYEAMLFN